jgi:hypothetical protein
LAEGSGCGWAGLAAVTTECPHPGLGCHHRYRRKRGEDGTSFVSLMSHRGVSIEEIAASPDTPPLAPPKSSTAANSDPLPAPQPTAIPADLAAITKCDHSSATISHERRFRACRGIGGSVAFIARIAQFRLSP